MSRTTKRSERRGRPEATRSEATRGERPRRWPRRLAYALAALGYVVIMWFAVFPWADRTFVNRPEVEGSFVPQQTPSARPSPSGSPS